MLFDIFTHGTAFVAGICAAIIAQVISHKLIRTSDASESENVEKTRFDAVERQVPDVVERIRTELEKSENRLVQELVVAPSEDIQLPGGKRRIYCYESQHDQLIEKLDRLVQEGYLSDIGTGNARILRISNEFLSRVKRDSH